MGPEDREPRRREGTKGSRRKGGEVAGNVCKPLSREASRFGTLARAITAPPRTKTSRQGRQVAKAAKEKREDAFLTVAWASRPWPVSRAFSLPQPDDARSEMGATQEESTRMGETPMPR